MKKLLYLFIALFAVTSCQKDPDFSDLSDDYMVYTINDPNYFKGSATPASTIYIPDFILDVQSGDQTAQWNDADAQSIIKVFKDQLTAMGYNTSVTDPLTADLNLKLTYTKDVTIFVDYPYYWWWDYWDGGYWPSWYYPYPYPYVYGYAVASLVGELVKPGVVANPASDTPPVVWNAFVGGPDYGGKHSDTPYFVKGANQAFKQSAYLKKN